MNNNHRTLMIIGCIFAVFVIYTMAQSGSSSRCGREGYADGGAYEGDDGDTPMVEPQPKPEPPDSATDATAFAADMGETTTPDSQLDNYNYFTKNSIPTVYYGPDKSTARVTMVGGENDDSDNDTKTYGITVTNENGSTVTYAMETSPSGATVNPITKAVEQATDSGTSTGSGAGTGAGLGAAVPQSIANTRFVDKDGNVAKLYVAKNGQYVVQTRQVNGYDMVYTSTNVFTYDRNNSKSFLVGDTVNDITPIDESRDTTNNLITSLTNNTISTRQALPTNGIPGRMIPPGQEDLYILKSQIVPPVCPRCPTICPSKTGDSSKCPPCPSCARCPESTDFTCKKVPDYSTNSSISGYGPGSAGAGYGPGSAGAGSGVWGPSSNISTSTGSNNGTAPNYNQYRNNTKFSPVPVVSNFSTFGM